MAYNIDRNGNLGTYGIGSSIGKDLIDAFGNPRADAEAEDRRSNREINEFKFQQAKAEAERIKAIEPKKNRIRDLISGWNDPDETDTENALVDFTEDGSMVSVPGKIPGKVNAPIFAHDPKNGLTIDRDLAKERLPEYLGLINEVYGHDSLTKMHPFFNQAAIAAPNPGESPSQFEITTGLTPTGANAKRQHGLPGLLSSLNAGLAKPTQEQQGTINEANRQASEFKRNQARLDAILAAETDNSLKKRFGTFVTPGGDIITGFEYGGNVTPAMLSPEPVAPASPPVAPPAAAAPMTVIPSSPALAGILAPGNRRSEDVYGFDLPPGLPPAAPADTPSPTPGGVYGPAGASGAAGDVDPEYPGVGPLIGRQTIRKTDITSQSSPKNTVPAGVIGEKMADGRTIYRRPAPVEGPTPTEARNEFLIENGYLTPEQKERAAVDRGKWEAGLPKQIAALIANPAGRIPGGSGKGGASSVNTDLNPFVNAIAYEISSKAMELEMAGYSPFEARKLASDMTLAAYRKDVRTEENFFRTQDTAKLVSPGAGVDKELSPSDVQTLIRSSNQANQGVLPSKAILGQKYIDQELRYRGIDQEDLNLIPIKARSQIVQSMTHIAFIEDIIKRSELNGGSSDCKQR